MSDNKALVFLTLLVLAFAGTTAHPQVTGQQRAKAAGRDLLGVPAPRLVLNTIDGKAIDLRSLYGKKAVYLKFWATWCVPCRQQMPHFEHVYEAAGSDMAVIAINVGFNDSIEAIRDYQKRLAITMPIVFDDGSLAAAFHLRVTPTHIVIGRDGRIEYVSHLADRDLDTALITARTVSSSQAQRKAIEMEDPPPIGVGDLLPSHSLQTLGGRRFELRPNVSQRQMTAVVFLSPWCESYLATTRPQVSAGCRNIRTQIDALAPDPRIRWVGIASGLWANRRDLRDYRAHYHITIPLTLDEWGGEFRAFRVNDVPTILVADVEGRIVRRIDGGTANDVAALRAAIVGF